MGTHRAFGLLSKIFGDLGDDGGFQGIWQRLAEYSQEAGFCHHDQVIETIVPSCLLKFCGDFVGEHDSLVFARAPLTAGGVMCGGTTTATDKWSVVEYASGPVRFEVTIMQVCKRIA